MSNCTILTQPYNTTTNYITMIHSFTYQDIHETHGTPFVGGTALRIKGTVQTKKAGILDKFRNGNKTE